MRGQRDGSSGSAMLRDQRLDCVLIMKTPKTKRMSCKGDSYEDGV